MPARICGKAAQLGAAGHRPARRAAERAGRQAMRFPPAEPACRVCRGKRASRADVHQRRGSAWCAGEGQPLGDERGRITGKAAQRAGSGHRPGRSAAERAAHFGRRPGGRWPAPARCRARWTAKTGDLLRGEAGADLRRGGAARSCWPGQRAELQSERPTSAALAAAG